MVAITSYLLLGGPAHGQQREVLNGDSSILVMAPSPGNPLPTPWKYVLREIEAETRPGLVFKRSILVEQSMPVNVATQALASLLMTNFAEELVRQFMEGGELVGNGTQQSRTENTPETDTSSRLLRA